MAIKPYFALALVLTASGCMVRSMPDSSGGVASSPDFLRDAAATCGNPTMLLPESRDFTGTTTVDRTNRIYDCVDHYLAASPEYRGIGPAATANDKAFVARMRQIDLQRAAGQISPGQAKSMAMEADRIHSGR